MATPSPAEWFAAEIEALSAAWWPSLRGARAQLERACRHAGAWLARFHAAPGSAHTRARGAVRDEVVEVTRGIVAALPAALPLGLHHGDFGPRNVFVEPDGRVVVFDTMAAWRAPRPAPAFSVALLAGYFGAQPVASAAVVWFEAQRLAERWATYVQRAAQASSARALAKRARARLAGRSFRRAIAARLATAEAGA